MKLPDVTRFALHYHSMAQVTESQEHMVAILGWMGSLSSVMYLLYVTPT